MYRINKQAKKYLHAVAQPLFYSLEDRIFLLIDYFSSHIKVFKYEYGFSSEEDVLERLSTEKVWKQ